MLPKNHASCGVTVAVCVCLVILGWRSVALCAGCCLAYVRTHAVVSVSRTIQRACWCLMRASSFRIFLIFPLDIDASRLQQQQARFLYSLALWYRARTYIHTAAAEAEFILTEEIQ